MYIFRYIVHIKRPYEDTVVMLCQQTSVGITWMQGSRTGGMTRLGWTEVYLQLLGATEILHELS